MAHVHTRSTHVGTHVHTRDRPAQVHAQHTCGTRVHAWSASDTGTHVDCTCTSAQLCTLTHWHVCKHGKLETFMRSVDHGNVCAPAAARAGRCHGENRWRNTAFPHCALLRYRQESM